MRIISLSLPRWDLHLVSHTNPHDMEYTMRFLSSVGLRAGDVVALEGAPIYLCDEPSSAHAHANALIDLLGRALSEMGCIPQLHVLLDEMTCIEQPGLRERYLEDLPMAPARVALESEMAEPGLTLLGSLASSRVQRGQGESGNQCVLCLEPYPILVTNRGRPACALMDSAFQVGKVATASIIVHPCTMQIDGATVDFMEQQDSMMGVLASRRGPGHEKHDALPWERGVIHLWLNEDGTVADGWRALNKGRAIKRHRSAIRVGEINEALARLH